MTSTGGLLAVTFTAAVVVVLPAASRAIAVIWCAVFSNVRESS